jgi:hypothetical protein
MTAELCGFEHNYVVFVVELWKEYNSLYSLTLRAPVTFASAKLFPFLQNSLYAGKRH